MDLSPLLILVAGGILGFGVALWHANRRERSLTPAPPPSPAAEPVASNGPAVDPATSGTAVVTSLVEQVFAIAAELEGLYRQSAYPRDLLQNERFQRGVELMGSAEFSSEMLLDYMVGANVVTACMALEALARRTGDPTSVTEPIIANVAQVHLWTAYFALRVLSFRVDEPVIGAVLAKADDDWINPLPLNILREFITLRLTRGEEPRFGTALDSLTDERAAHVAAVLERLGDILPGSLHDEFRIWRESRVDKTLLGGVGRVWQHDPRELGVATSTRLDEVTADLELLLRARPPHSIALVGENGVGKSAVIRLLANRLVQQGWVVFESATADLMAGQMYVGQLEERVKSLIGAVRGRQVLWIVPNFHELLWAGRHQQNPQGALDLLLPAIEAGEICLLG